VTNLLKTGVIGAGVFGGHHARKYASHARVSLLGIYDPDQARAAALAGSLDDVRVYDSLEDLLSDVDAVTIASPARYHGAQAKAALAAECHVLVEKPLAVTSAEAEACVNLAEANKRVLQAGHQERFVFQAMGALSAPEAPTRITARRKGPFSERGADASVTFDLMVHDIDLACRLAVGPATSVQGETKSEKTALPDYAKARIAFQGGLVAELEASRLADERDRVMRIEYPSGALTVDFIAKSFDNQTPFAFNPDFAKDPKAADSLGANVSAFIDSVLDGAPVAVPGAQALEAVRIAERVDAR